jgi:hypothetical protein
MTMADATKPRRSRADSKTSAVAAMQAATRKIKPPATMKLDRDEQVIFDEVIGECAAIEWTPHQVTVAAMLAKEILSHQREMVQLRREGSVLTNSRGNAVLNPRVRALHGHAASVLSLRRSLALHARAKGGDARDIARRRQINRENQTALDDPEGLIPRGPLN